MWWEGGSGNIVIIFIFCSKLPHYHSILSKSHRNSGRMNIFEWHWQCVVRIYYTNQSALCTCQSNAIRIAPHLDAIQNLKRMIRIYDVVRLLFSSFFISLISYLFVICFGHSTTRNFAYYCNESLISIKLMILKRCKPNKILQR